MWRKGVRSLGRLLVTNLVSVALAASSVTGQSARTDSTAPARQPSTAPVDDGWFDLSAFLDKKYGFMPIAALITEPSVGYGAVGGLAFIDSPFSQGRPNITFVGGLGTENGTKGAMGADMRQWLGNTLETRVAFVDMSVNLDFYGIGEDPILADHPLRYSIKPTGGLLEARYRIRKSPVWAGMRYSYAQTGVTFEAPDGTPGLPDFNRTTKVGGLTPSLTLEKRNNFFTPTRGTYLETTLGLYSPALGADETFQRFQFVGMQYVPLRRALFLGVRGQVSTSSTNTPFYMRPYIYQRGVPAMRYMGTVVTQIEGELRWQFWKRFSLVGFGGKGANWVEAERFESFFENLNTVGAGGAGFRYEIARKYGLHVGADVATGPDGAAWYIQFGSAWLR
jgi:hypothetical protein